MNKAVYKHVIWDWNGTLLDDVDECVGVVNGMLSRRGLASLTVERYRELFGFPLIEFYRALGFDLEKESFDVVAREYHESSVERVRYCQLQRGAEEVLTAVAGAGMTQSLLSAYEQERLKEAADFFGVGKWFVAMVGLNDYYAHSKVENGLRWVEQAGYRLDEILLVGDTTHDYEVAQEIGVDCVLLTCGHQVRGRLAECGVRLCDSLGQLESFLAGR